MYKTNLKYNKLNQLVMFSEQADGEAHKTEFAYDRDSRVTGITYDGSSHKMNYIVAAVNGEDILKGTLVGAAVGGAAGLVGGAVVSVINCCCSN